LQNSLIKGVEKYLAKTCFQLRLNAKPAFFSLLSNVDARYPILIRCFGGLFDLFTGSPYSLPEAEHQQKHQ
jgi:hypothetical protein